MNKVKELYEVVRSLLMFLFSNSEGDNSEIPISEFFRYFRRINYGNYGIDDVRQQQHTVSVST